MTVWVYLPVLLSVLLVAAARLLPIRVVPARAARALAVAAAVAAGATTVCLTLLASTLFDDLPPLSVLDRLPASGLPEPVPGWVALTAVVLLAAGAVRVLRLLVERRRTLRRLRGVGEPFGGLVVAAWQSPYAIAVPGRPGHVLVTSGMLRLLDDDERRVLFAHERSHLRRRHHRLVSVTSLAAAINPLLIPLARSQTHVVERWADEDAAAAVGGDRALVARAVAKASLATVGDGPVPVLGLHGAGTGTVQRITALIRPVRLSGVRRLAGIALICVALVVATTAAAVDFVQVAHVWLTFTRP